jgi:hypothetical protein
MSDQETRKGQALVSLPPRQSRHRVMLVSV